MYSSKMLQFPNSRTLIVNKTLSLSIGSCKPNSHFKLRLAGGSKCATDKIQLPNGGLEPELMPKHVAVIMDESRRWARNRLLPPQLGHSAGRKALKQLVVNSMKYGVKVLSVFAFSTENWARPKEEVDFLVSLFEEIIQLEIDEIIRKDVRLSFVGNRRRLPKSLEKLISVAEERGKDNHGLQLVIAMNYSGRYDITEATKKIAMQVRDGFCKVEDIEDAMVGQHLEISGIEFPRPDLIRTSGELRVSNFMLWQLAYTEMFFTNKPFPDFDDTDLADAISAFRKNAKSVMLKMTFLILILLNTKVATWSC